MKILRLISIAFLFGSPCIATTLSTQWEALSESVAASLNSYMKSHNGELPPDLNSLYSDYQKALLEEQLKGPIMAKIIYFRENRPALEGASNTELIAITSFPIKEDRRNELGRYIIYKEPNGEMRSKWLSEQTIQISAKKADIHLPSAHIYSEKPLKPLNPDYANKLVEDAVVKHGFSLEEATRLVEQHVADVLNGRAKEVKSWEEIITYQSPTPQTKVSPSSSLPSANPKSSVETKK